MSIQLTGLVKYFGEQLVVNNVSLEIADGEFFALLGASGSGKSTILRMIAGLSIPDQGRILLNGRDVTRMPPQKREIGFVFQNYAIFKHMSVADNIEFGLKVRGVKAEERIQRQEELLELVGLSGLGSRFPSQLSGGQRQRVALARALAYKPSVLLLDEPFGALDARIRSQLRESIKEIQSSLKVTTIIVTHDQEEAFELASRIGIIEKGRLVEVNDAESLYHKPRSAFTATFIGGGNVMVGRFRNEKIQLGNVQLPMPEEAPKHNEGDPIRVLFRAENVAYQSEPFPESNGQFSLGQGVLEDQQFSGSYIRSRLRLESLRGARPLTPYPRYGKGLSVTSIQPSWTHKREFKNGDRCWISLSNYHVLAPSALRILIRHDVENPASSAWEFGSMLAAAARGTAKLVCVCENQESLDEAKKKLQQFALDNQKSASLLLELETRAGDEAHEILNITQEGFFEVVILDREQIRPDKWKGLNDLSISLLEEANVPVLLMAEKREALKKILICTAAGEPGKSDVQLGARFARQTGAAVTVLHVTRPGTSPEQMRRSERHLAEAKKVLDELGVECEILIKNPPAMQQILDVAKEGDFDLIVIGASGRNENHTSTFSAQIVQASSRPVLIVPNSE